MAEDQERIALLERALRYMLSCDVAWDDDEKRLLVVPKKALRRGWEVLGQEMPQLPSERLDYWKRGRVR